MAQRRYGPTRGAGTTITELEGEKTIEPSALGWVGYAGILEKGPTDKLIFAPNKAQFTKKCGGIIDGSLLPDACHDFYNLANGAGGILLSRITDGNELQAQATLYARYGDILTPMGTLKAHNGGRWGGQKKDYWGELAAEGDLTETTLDTKDTGMTIDEWKGGYVMLEEVPNTQYEITGNDTDGVITVVGDATMKTDWGSGPGLNYYLVRENEAKAVGYIIHDGEEKPDTEFGMSIYIDGDFLKKYPNLATNPSDPRYWVEVINNDSDNWAVFAVDTWTGGHTAAVRPANHYGKIVTVTATVLTAEIHDFTVNAPVSGGNPTFALGTTADIMKAQKITITMDAATTGTAVSDVFGTLGDVTLATEFNPPAGTGGADPNKWAPPFTVTAGATPLAADDTLVINYKPFIADQLIGGKLYPDKPNAKLENYLITDNDHKTITVADGSDLTASGETDDYFLVEGYQEMAGGIDGNSEIADGDYNNKGWSISASLFNRIAGQDLGLVKFATPGITSTAVQKAGVLYAESKNHQYRYEAPSNVVTEDAAIILINDTLGRSDMAVMTLPSYGYITDPGDTGEGKRKLVSTTGMIHGREARITADYDGYHKAEAGTDAKLSALLDLPTGDAILDEERLNPVGISVIKKAKGNYIIWGDRMLASDPTWKWKHQREQMSYYEHVLQENFDWIIFAINDPIEQKPALTALLSFFRPEWVKRALRGAQFQDAATIRIDSEINTDATMADGDMFAEIILRLADTVERFNIKIGKQGIFDSVG